VSKQNLPNLQGKLRARLGVKKNKAGAPHPQSSRKAQLCGEWEQPGRARRYRNGRRGSGQACRSREGKPPEAAPAATLRCRRPQTERGRPV